MAGRRKTASIQPEVLSAAEMKVQKDCPEASMTKAVHGARIIAKQAGETTAVEYIQRFSQQSGNRSVPITAVYDIAGKVVNKTLLVEQGCSGYKYGILGYLDLPSGHQESPAFYERDTFKRTLLNTVRILVRHVDALPQGTDIGLMSDLTSKMLMWCGIPKGKAAIELHAQCVEWLLDLNKLSSQCFRQRLYQGE